MRFNNVNNDLGIGALKEVGNTAAAVPQQIALYGGIVGLANGKPGALIDLADAFLFRPPHFEPSNTTQKVGGYGVLGASLFINPEMGTEEGALGIEAKLGSYIGYHGYDSSGVVRYVGITMRDAAERFGEHLAAKGTGKELLRYEAVEGAEGMTKLEARIWEQQQILKYKLGKEGGQLLNKINSIAQKYWQLYGIQ
jgi:hypothetical protein